MRIIRKIYKSLVFRVSFLKKNRKEKKLFNCINKHKLYISEIKKLNFSIISSNCWAGSVYEDLKLQYLTPTIGLFFYAPCYLDFLKNLIYYLDQKLTFTEHSKYEEANKYRNENFAYPVGLLGNQVEIHFLHYKASQEAFEKWERRKQRIVWDNLYIAMTDRDLCTYDLMMEFDNLPYKKKVLFTAKKYPEIKCGVQLKAFKKDKEVGDLYNQRYLVTPDFKLKSWLEK